MQLIQKLSGRPGANTYAPAPLQQQAPWHSQGQQSNAHYQQPGAGYSQGHQTGFALQQQAQPYAQQPAAFQQGQQQAWGGQQASEPAQQGCGGFLKSLLGALFGKWYSNVYILYIAADMTFLTMISCWSTNGLKLRTCDKAAQNCPVALMTAHVEISLVILTDWLSVT